MTKMVIKNVRISSIALWMAVFMAVFVLVASVVFTVIFLGFSMTSAAPSIGFTGVEAAGRGFMQFLIIIMFAYSLVGFLGGALCGFIYNAYAGKSVAGIEFDVES